MSQGPHALRATTTTHHPQEGELVDPGAHVAARCRIGDTAWVERDAVVAGRGAQVGSCVKIGAGARIGEGVTIRPDVVVPAGTVVTVDLDLAA